MDEELKLRIEEITRSTQRMVQKYNAMQPELTRQLRAIQEAMQPYADLIARVTEVTEQIRNAYSPILERLCEIAPTVATGLEKLREDQAEKIRLLAENGWFPDFCAASLGRVFELNDQYYETYSLQGREQADALLVGHFEEIMLLFPEEVSCEFPRSRFLIIQDAIKAHQEERYSLSTPIFLMQADGYAADTHRRPVWGPKAKLFSDAREANQSTYLGAMLEPLLQKDLPISASWKQRAHEGFPKHIVNRHAVLHGECSEYGTRENSARAFSFMWYCMFFMDTFFTDEEECPC